MPHFYQTFYSFCVLLHSRKFVTIEPRSFSSSSDLKLVLKSQAATTSWNRDENKVYKKKLRLKDWVQKFNRDWRKKEEEKMLFSMSNIWNVAIFSEPWNDSLIHLSHSIMWLESPIRFLTNHCLTQKKHFFNWVLPHYETRALIDWLHGGFTVCRELSMALKDPRISWDFHKAKIVFEIVSVDVFKVEPRCWWQCFNQLTGRVWI